MVWAKRAAVQIKVGAAQRPLKPTSEPAYSPTQIATVMAKKSCPSDACAMVAQAGVTNFTATPPSAACAATTITAIQASLAATEEPLPNGRGSDWSGSDCSVATPSEPRPCGSVPHPHRQADREQTHQHGRHAVRELVADAAFERGHQVAPGKRPIGHGQGRVVAHDLCAGDHQPEGTASHEHRVAAQPERSHIVKMHGNWGKLPKTCPFLSILYR